MRLHIKFIAVIFIVTLVSICLDYKRFLDTPLNINTSLIFTIDSGSSFKDLNKKLKSYHILDKPYYFEFYARYSGYAKKIQSGEYQLSPGLTPIKIINIFVSGDVIQHSITLLEGWTIKDIKKEISSNTVLIKNLTDYSSDSLLKKIKITESNVEGLFFPDTYYFTKGASDIELLQRAYRRGKAILEKEWESRDAGLPYKNDYDALIMASIIEKETALASERAMIAGVFVRRLKNNMKLQ